MNMSTAQLIQPYHLETLSKNAVNPFPNDKY